MDLAFVEFVQSFRNGFLDLFFSLITEFGGDLIFLVVGTLLFWLYDKRFGYRFMTVFLITLGINDIFKNFIRRPRPFATGAESVTEETYGYSMPSAHASNVGIMALILNERFGKLKRFVTPVIFTVMVLVGFSRVYLGQHYLSDVMMGFVLAFGVYYGIKVVGPKITLSGTTVISVTLAVFFIFMVVFGLAREGLGIEPESFRNLYIAFGSVLGLTVGHIIELKYVGYKEKAPWKIQLVKYLIGLVVALMIQEGLKVILPYNNMGEMGSVVLDSLRYFILTMWLSLGALFTFKQIFKTYQ